VPLVADAAELARAEAEAIMGDEELARGEKG
jgi:hypothetical protein